MSGTTVGLLEKQSILWDFLLPFSVSEHHLRLPLFF